MTDNFVVCRDGTDSCDVLAAVYLLAHCAQLLDSLVNRLGDTAAENHRVSTGGNVLHTLADKHLSENGSGGSTVACRIVGLCCDLLDELCAHVLHSVVKLDLLGDCNTVVDDHRCAVLLFENDVSALRSECDLNRICKLINTAKQCVSCVHTVHKFLSHIYIPPI